MPTIVQPTKTKRECRVNLCFDTSQSNAHDGKIGAVNFAAREVRDPLRDLAAKNPQMAMLLQVYEFGGAARRHFANPVPPEDYQWTDVAAAGLTPFGAALGLVREDLDRIPAETPCYAPAIIVVSDGMPNDDWEQQLEALNRTYWGRKANRVAVAIGSDCDHSVLQRFLGSSELGVLEATNADQVVNAVVTATLRASQASVAGAQEPPSQSVLGGRNGSGQLSLIPDSPADSVPPSILDNASVENAKW